MPVLSVVVPTYKRHTTLQKCLDHLEKQTIANNMEVIVVSDGHDENTAQIFKNNTWNMPLKFLAIEKSQQGLARNRGVKEARGAITLYLGDDIFLKPGAAERHVKAHEAFKNSTVLGYTTWDPAVGITRVMRWLESSGWQFDYCRLKKLEHQFLPENIQHRYTYTSNISLPTSLALNHPFRSDVTMYGWEDVEWGMRLRNAGIPLYFAPQAIGFHHHKVTMKQSLERMETLGEAAIFIAEKVPHFDRVPRGWKFAGYKCAALLPTMAGRHRKAFLRGIKKGLRKQVET